MIIAALMLISMIDAKFGRYQRFMDYHNVRKTILLLKNIIISIIYIKIIRIFMKNDSQIIFKVKRENNRATQFKNFHTSDEKNPTPAPKHANHHNFQDLVNFCEEIDPRNEMYFCEKVKMLSRHLVNNGPGLDNHNKWKLCDRILQRQEHPNRITRNRLDKLCLSYMQMLYNTTKRNSFLDSRGSNGRSKVYTTHFGNN